MPTAVSARGSTAVALLVITTAQLMLVLDDSIVTIALPRIQEDLDVAPVHLPWIVNGYILAFGALLLLGGRIGDLRGRRRTLQAGLTLFILGSLAGGLGLSAEMLIAARAVQGVGAALTAPNALALIATTFHDRPTRDKAFSLYGAMSGLGIVVGLLLGGVLTDALGWRWVFFINVPIGLLVLLGSRSLATSTPRPGRPGALGAALGSGGMVALVGSITRFGERGPSDPITWGLVGAGVVLLTFFVLSQRRARTPLMPLELFADPGRGGSFAAMLLLAVGPMGTFYIITLFLQHVLEYSPLRTGLAWLPFAAGLVLAAGAAPKLLLRRAPRTVGAAGALISAAAALWLSAIGLDTGYWTHLAPAMFLLAVGFGIGILTLTQSAVHRVDEGVAGITSALLNSAQQIGVALGLTTLAAVAAAVTGAPGSGHAAGGATEAGAASAADLVSGYSAALLTGAGLLVAAASIAAIMLPSSPLTDAAPEAEQPAEARSGSR